MPNKETASAPAACYNTGMADIRPESRSPTLAEANPWIRDADARHERFLDVAERNSVIEGLPPFSAEFREELKNQLKKSASRGRAPRE